MTRTDNDLIREILLCGINDGDLYRRQIQPIIANLQRKIAKGTYNPVLALKLWQYAANAMVLLYSVEQMGRAKPTLTILSKADRALLAGDIAAQFAEEVEGA